MTSPIDAVQVVDLPMFVDDRGMLFEILHKSDPFVDDNGGFGQCYCVIDPMPFTVRAYHKHEKLWDYFTIVNGSAKFVLFETYKTTNCPDSIRDNVKIITLNARKPQVLVVPAGVYHGWMSLEPNTILVSNANQEYNKAAPDESRIAPNFIYPNPFVVEAK